MLNGRAMNKMEPCDRVLKLRVFNSGRLRPGVFLCIYMNIIICVIYTVFLVN